MIAATLRHPSFLARSPVAPARHVAVKPISAPVCRAPVVVHAVDDETKPPQKKKVPSAVKRAKLAVERRLYNRSRKSACATRIKKVIKLAGEMVASPPKTEEEIAPLQQLINEAYKEVDKAVSKGVIHKNTGARRKARCARYKRLVLMTAGLFKPDENHPDYPKYLQLLEQKQVQQHPEQQHAAGAVSGQA